MKYAIIANPASGKHSRNRKYRILKEVQDILGGKDECHIAGLDTESVEEYIACARNYYDKAETLVNAGGDGTMHLLYNNLDREIRFGVLPLGSGNSLHGTLGLPDTPQETAEKIKVGSMHTIDLIACLAGKDEKPTKAMFGGLGIEANVLHERDKFKRYIKGFVSYALAVPRPYLFEFEKGSATIGYDQTTQEIDSFLAIIIAKIPYFGYGLKIMPHADPEDGKLHLMSADPEFFEFLYAIYTSFRGGNKVGCRLSAEEFTISTEKERIWQLDGEVQQDKDNNPRKDSTFKFQVLPKELKLIY